MPQSEEGSSWIATPRPESRRLRWSMLLAASMLATTACQSGSRLEFGKGLDVPYVETPPKVVSAMLRSAHVGSHDVVLDLGCGDGRIIVAAAKEFGARGIGYDIDPQRITEARQNAARAGVAARAQFVQKDLFDVKISEASVVTVFLLPAVLDKLRPRFLRELAPGTRIVSHSFPIRDWNPDRKLLVEGRTLYLYTVPIVQECGPDSSEGMEHGAPCSGLRLLNPSRAHSQRASK